MSNPGPGAYPIHEKVHKGQMRSFLGGKIPDLKKQDPGFVNPGPGAYTNEVKDHVTSYLIKEPIEQKKRQRMNAQNSQSLVGPQTYEPRVHQKFFRSFRPGYSIGRGVREPGRNKTGIEPFGYEVPRDFDEKSDPKNPGKKLIP
jgi:hypothetical protein